MLSFKVRSTSPTILLIVNYSVIDDIEQSMEAMVNTNILANVGKFYLDNLHKCVNSSLTEPLLNEYRCAAEDSL